MLKPFRTAGYLAPHRVALRNDQPNPGCPAVN